MGSWGVLAWGAYLDPDSRKRRSRCGSDRRVDSQHGDLVQISEKIPRAYCERRDSDVPGEGTPWSPRMQVCGPKSQWYGWPTPQVQLVAVGHRRPAGAQYRRHVQGPLGGWVKAISHGATCSRRARLSWRSALTFTRFLVPHTAATPSSSRVGPRLGVQSRSTRTDVQHRRLRATLQIRP